LLPYEHFTAHHIAFDLITTCCRFLKKAKDEGAKIKTADLVFKQKKHGKSGINKLHY
jgi:hypothetical protein